MENFKELNYRGTDLLVGDCGTIYRDGRLAHQTETPDGYLQIYIPGSSIKVHRLVAMCFVPGQSDDRNEVNHKDFNRKNNCSSNLGWMTHAENVQYSAQAGRKSDITGYKNPNWGNDTLHKKYANDPELAQICQSRPGARNGRATPIDIYRACDGEEEFIGHFEYLGEAATYMNANYGFSENPEVFRQGVRQSIKRGSPYKGFIFKKEAS